MVRRHEVLKLLKQGKTVKEIATITGTKIANIKAHRKRIIGAKLWRAPDAGLQWPLDIDQVTDVLIDRFEKAKKVPELEAKIKTLENQLAATRNQLTVLIADTEKRADREKRYKLAVQQGEINPPVPRS